jgi:hypothetical protein
MVVGLGFNPLTEHTYIGGCIGIQSVGRTRRLDWSPIHFLNKRIGFGFFLFFEDGSVALLIMRRAINMYKVLKQVNRETGISIKAVITMNSFVNGIFEGIAAEAYHTTM